MIEFNEIFSNLKPYIRKYEITASKNSLPVIRSMATVFHEDLTCSNLSNQYMVGESILVVPQSNEEADDNYYLPEGLWTDYFTGKEYKGGEWVSKEEDNTQTPVMVRDNSIIVTSPSDDFYELRAYAIHNGIATYADIYGNDGESVLGVTLKRLGRSIHITVDGSLPYCIRMINMHAKFSVNGFITIEGNDSIITPDRGAEMIEIRF
jgi:alpha-D-xyloside xylohydrolase